MTWFEGAEAKHLHALAVELDRGAVQLADARFKLQQIGFPTLAVDAAAGELRGFHTQGWTASQVARAVDAVASERARTERRRDDIELVWSGPDALGTESRDSARVLEELFEGATRSVLIAGYNLQPGAHFDALARVARGNPSLRVKVFAHVFADKYPTLGEALAAHDAGLRAALGAVPSAQVRAHRPSGPLLEQARAKHFNMHAKCVTIDERRVLVTSANFSYTAQERNVEVGVALDDPRLAARIRIQFETLVKRCDMVAHTF